MNSNSTSNQIAASMAESSSTKTDDLEEGSGQKNFAEKLYSLLEIEDYQGVFHWLPTGEAFCINDQSAFEAKILAKHFPSAKFPSFTRRMRRWGFTRVETPDQRTSGLIIFTCPRFRKGQADLCKLMCDDRQVKKMQKQARALVNQSLGANKTNPIRDANQLSSLQQPVGLAASHTSQYLNSSYAATSQIDRFLFGGLSSMPTHLLGSMYPAASTAGALFNQTKSLGLNMSIQSAASNLSEIRANIHQIEAELAILSRMRQLQQQHLGHSAMSQGHSLTPQSSLASCLFSNQGSPPSCDNVHSTSSKS